MFRVLSLVKLWCVDYSGWCGLWLGWLLLDICGDTVVHLVNNILPMWWHQSGFNWWTAHSAHTGICVTISIHRGVLNCSISDHALCAHTFMYIVKLGDTHVCLTHMCAYVCVFFFVCIRVCVCVFVCLSVSVCIHKSVCLRMLGADGSSREDFAAAARQQLLVGGLSQLQLHWGVCDASGNTIYCIALHWSSCFPLHCKHAINLKKRMQLIQEKKIKNLWQRIVFFLSWIKQHDWLQCKG